MSWLAASQNVALSNFHGHALAHLAVFVGSIFLSQLLYVGHVFKRIFFVKIEKYIYMALIFYIKIKMLSLWNCDSHFVYAPRVFMSWNCFRNSGRDGYKAYKDNNVAKTISVKQNDSKIFAIRSCFFRLFVFFFLVKVGLFRDTIF